MSTQHLTNQSAHPVDAGMEQKTAECLALRIAGASYRKIAASLGISKSAAHEYTITALRELEALNAEDAKELRRLECERLDAMLLKLWPQTSTAKLSERTADTVLRIMERRSKLLGLDAPVDSRLGGLPGGVPIALSTEPDLSKLTFEQLQNLNHLLSVASPEVLPSPETTNG